MKIAVIDYNAGNIASVTNALERFGYKYVVTRDAREILAADKVIFPGQGRAGPAMQSLRDAGLDTVIPRITKPFLGICLGMQLLFETSEEDGTLCLDIIGGTSKKFSGVGIKVPQMGWNTVRQLRFDSLFRNIPDVLYAYFVHSYYAKTDSTCVIGATTYGGVTFPSIVRKANFYGTQFHPEKSGGIGLQLLKNFCELELQKPNPILVIPAIDLIDGTCVRLRQGNYDERTTYSDNPRAVAREFVKIGAPYLHIVDLNGAKSGTPMNARVIISIVEDIGVPVQIGGGIRTFADAKKYLDAGAQRVIISTSALNDPEVVREIVAVYGPGRIAVSVDVRNNRVAARGWHDDSPETVESFLEKLLDLGITTIIYTDIKKDGTLEGPNYERIGKILKKPFHVIVAGGVASIQDVKKLQEMGAYGVIIGKALYEKTIDLGHVYASIRSPEIPRSVLPARDVARRVIPCMDIAAGRVVKGTHFKNLRDAGDPVELAKRYSEMGADELVFLDITATIEERRTLYELVERIAKNINIPFTVGGGVQSIEDVKRLLDAGADKVSIGSAAIKNPSLITEAAQEFGSQCIVISVDPKRKGVSWEMYIKGGREATGVDAIEFCKDMARRGAGELLVNSLDKDGTKSGYDLELLRRVSEAVAIPVIASSGAGSKKDFLEACTVGKADAVLAATLFHTGALNIPELKAYLADNNIPMRI